MAESIYNDVYEFEGKTELKDEQIIEADWSYRDT